MVTENKIENLMQSGKKLSAIQVLVKEEGFSLKEAKDYVDQYQIEHEMDETAVNQNDGNFENQGEASPLLIFAIFAFLFLLIVFITAPIICKNTKVLQGFFGVCFWLFLRGRLIFATSIVSVCFLWQIIKAPNKAKATGTFLAISLLLFIFICADGKELVKAAKDVVSKPVEVSFADYEVKNIYMTTGRSGGSSRICYSVVPENNQGVDRILMPVKSVKNIPARMPWREPDIAALRKEQGTITVFVYPNTGIIANQESLEILSKNIIY